jgi:hypothetical protein
MKSGGLEFEAVIGGDGIIRVPRRLMARLGKEPGSRVHVRLTPEVIHRALRRRNVTAGEVDRIASLQLESREQVIAFLLAEGALAPGRAGGRAK